MTAGYGGLGVCVTVFSSLQMTEALLLHLTRKKGARVPGNTYSRLLLKMARQELKTCSWAERRAAGRRMRDPGWEGRVEGGSQTLQHREGTGEKYVMGGRKGTGSRDVLIKQAFT